MIATGLIWLCVGIIRHESGGHTPSRSLVADLRELKVQLKWRHQAQFAGFYIAKEKGYFEKRGLAVTLMQGGPGNNAISTVLSGGADIGVWGSEQVLINKSEGKPIKAIGVVYQQSPACWMVRAESPVMSLRDLTTQTIGVQAPGTDFDIIYRATTNQLKLDRNKLKERQVDFNLALFTTGQVDVWPSYSINEPFIAESQNIRVRCINPSDSGVAFYGDTVFTTDEQIQKREADLRAFMWALAEGWDYALGHTEESVSATLRWNKDLPKAAQQHMIQQSVGLVRPAGSSHLFKMDSKRWERMQDLLLALTLMNKRVDPDSLFTNGLLPIL